MKQRGRNKAYPERVEVWRKGEDVPEWLSDRAKVISVDLGTGKKILKIVNLSSGGIEILSSDGVNCLVKTVGEDDLICFGDNRVFSLTPIQAKLLYMEE